MVQENSMPYGMIGEDTSSDLEKMAKYTGVVGWDTLAPHFESGALVYVDPSLELTEVGKAFTNDQKSKVTAWMKSGDLVKPSAPHATHWKSTKAEFTALVVSPFVLIRPV